MGQAGLSPRDAGGCAGRRFFLSRFSDCFCACRNWARGPCTPMRPSTHISWANCWPAKNITYDSMDRHGPALAALALPLVRLQGAKTFAELTEAELRRTPVVAGTITILLFGAAAEIFGFVPCVIAALLFACAPFTVYYDRYFIHESLFVAVTFGLILSGWYACTRLSAKQAALAAICAALMLASKETAVLHFAALAGAALLYWLWNLRRKSLRNLWRPWTLLTAILVFLLLSVALFTWFGRSWSALAALAPAAAELCGARRRRRPRETLLVLRATARRGPLGRVDLRRGMRRAAAGGAQARGFAVCLAGVLCSFIFVFYSVIPYKTPWLALNFWLPIALLAGLAVASLWRVPVKHRAVRVALRAACFVTALWPWFSSRTIRGSASFCILPTRTIPMPTRIRLRICSGCPTEIAEMVRQEGLASPRIAVIAADPWPLPWYLRQYSQVGYWQPGQTVGQADFYITSTDAANQYADQLKISTRISSASGPAC